MQKPKIKLEIVISLEFWVVFTDSSLVGNPVVHPAGFVLCYTQTFYCNKVSVWEPYFLLKVKPRHAALIFEPVYRSTVQKNTNLHTVIFSLFPYFQFSSSNLHYASLSSVCSRIFSLLPYLQFALVYSVCSVICSLLPYLQFVTFFVSNCSSWFV